MAQPHAWASNNSRGLPPAAGTKTAASARVARRTSVLTSERTQARPLTAAGIVGRRVRGTVRASTISQPASAVSVRSTARAAATCPLASSTTMTLRLVPGAKLDVSTPIGTSP